MRWGVVFVLVVLASPAVASGEVLCVPSTSIAGCPATGSEQEPTIQDAVNNGNPGDEILIGPDSANGGPYNESVTDSTTAYNFVGAGVGQTVIQGKGSPAMTVASGSTVTGLRINLYGAPGETGLSLAGSANDVAVTATEPASTMNNIGVDLNGGTFSHGTVTLPLTGGDARDYGGVIGSGTVSDSSITAEVGITGDSGGDMPTAHRNTITANEGVVDEGTFTIDDSLIKTMAGPTQEAGLETDPSVFSASITARHLTIIGSDSSGSVGVSASSAGVLFQASTTVLLASSIMQGYATSIASTATAPFENATTVVTIGHSFYDPSTEHVSDSPPTAVATIAADSHSGNTNPLFVDAGTGNFQLQAGSPAIDAGDPAPLAAGESTTDLAGNPRAVAGRKGDAAVSDVGAYELQPHAPTVAAGASASTGPPGQAIVFTARGSDPSPGDSLTYRWSFSGGGTASGARTTRSFAKPGRYAATVTATDLDGFTAAATRTVTITASKPRLTGLKLKPRSFKRGHAATIGYRDSAAARTTLTIERRKGRRWVKVLALKHHDRSGANKVMLNSKRLKAGAYRVVAVARDAGGSSNSATASFTVKR